MTTENEPPATATSMSSSPKNSSEEAATATAAASCSQTRALAATLPRAKTDDDDDDDNDSSEAATRTKTNKKNSPPPSLGSLHSSAATHHRAGNFEKALEGYSVAIDASRRHGVVHRDLHVCFCNRALVLLRLSRPEEALEDARQALRLLRSGGKGGGVFSPSLARALRAEASALNALSRFEQAFETADSGLSTFPGDEALALEAEVAAKGMREQARATAAVSDARTEEEKNSDGSTSSSLSSPSPSSPSSPSSLISLAADALVLRRHERLCSAFPPPSQAALVTPVQVWKDAKMRDAHSFAVVRCDEAAPARALSAVADVSRLSRWRAAVRAAVIRVASDNNLEPALLDIGGGLFAGALAAEGVVAAAEVMAAAEEEEEGEGAASAATKTMKSAPLSLPRGRAAVVECWAYLADSARDVLDAGGFDAACVRVIHARADQVAADGRVRGSDGGGKSGGDRGGVSATAAAPAAPSPSSSSSSSSSALSLAPVPPTLPPICANVVVAAGLVDDGLLSGGIVPALRHALAELSVRGEGGRGGEEDGSEDGGGGGGGGGGNREKAPPPPPPPSLLPIIVPRAAAVFACLAQISCCDQAFSQRGGREGKEGGGPRVFDRSVLRSSVDSRRWSPGGFSCGAPLAPRAWRRLSGNVRLLDLDFRALALTSGEEEEGEGEEEEEEEGGEEGEEGALDGDKAKSSSPSSSFSSSFSSVVEACATAPGVANAVVVWHELDLGDGGERLSSGPNDEEEGEEEEEEEEEEDAVDSSLPPRRQQQQQRKQQQQQQQRKQQQQQRSRHLQRLHRHRHLHPTVHWLEGGIPVLPGTPLLFKARHNTARIEVKAVLKEQEDKGKKTSSSSSSSSSLFLSSPSPYLYRCLPDLAFPQPLFAAFRDTRKLSCYFKGLRAAVTCAKERDGFANVLVEGGISSGNGGGGGNAAVALAAAAAGADSVVVCEPLPSTAAVARSLVAASGFARVVKVLEGGGRTGSGRGGKGDEMINVLALDAFDASLLGAGCEALARSVATRRSPFLAPRGLAAVVPARGTLWCVGVEAKCGAIGGGGGGGSGSGGGENDGGGGSDGGSPRLLLSDLSALDRYRWRPSATTIDLETEPDLRLLTKRARAWEGSFGFSEEDEEEEEGEEEEVEGENGTKKGKKKNKRASALPLDLDASAKGELTAVAFWFELDFGGGVRLSTEPLRWKEEDEERERRKEEENDDDDDDDDDDDHDDDDDDGGGGGGGSGIESGSGRRSESGSENESSSSLLRRHRHRHHQHHWGHSLQYLDRWCLLDPNGRESEQKKARLVARRPRGRWGGVRVALRRAAAAPAARAPPLRPSAAAVASSPPSPPPPSSSPSSSSSLSPSPTSRWAPRAPWLEEWGGGVSIENPHVQRSKYFDLVAADALQRACREGSMSSLGGVAPRRADDWVFAASLGNRNDGDIVLYSSSFSWSSSSLSSSSSATLVARFAGRRPPPSIADDLSPLVAQTGSLGLDLAETSGQARRWAIAEVLAKRSAGGGRVEVAAEAEALGARPLWTC